MSADRIGLARLARLRRSLAGRLLLLALVFAALPILVYDRFQRADEVTRQMLLQNVARQGDLIARAMEPGLAAAGPDDLPDVGRALARFADGRTGLKLLLRPDLPGVGEGFFYVAAVPEVTAADLDIERLRLIEDGVLRHIGEGCRGGRPLALRVGPSELVTSITPLFTGLGCWALVTSHAADGFLGNTIGQPYWRTATVRVAAVIYLGMAGLILAVLMSAWSELRRFRAHAQAIVSGEDETGSFAVRDMVPELAGVAEELDRLVASLRRSADIQRQAAEDAAHAFKTPIAVIRQATEPLRRAVAADDSRSRRALTMIEASVDKLDGLVSSTRRMDTAVAGLLPVPRRRVDLSRLAARLAESSAGQLDERGRRLEMNVASGIIVRAGEDMLETVIENLLDNAGSFAPAGGAVTLGLRKEGGLAVLTVEDEGPGVPSVNLPRIFDRYFSSRRPEHAGGTNFGIGLWIARRNIEAVGGSIAAENRVEGGFRIRFTVPLAEER